MHRARRFLAVLCILAVLACAVLAPAGGGSSPAVLVPLAPLFGFVLVAAARPDDSTPLYSYLDSDPSPSRAPPSIA